MPLACLRSFFFPAFLASFLVLCGSFYLELGLGLAACPLCLGQRFLLATFSLTCLMAMLRAPGRSGARIWLWACLGQSLAGSALAARHVWLQGLFPSPEIPCEQNLAYLLEQGTASQWLHALVLGSAECVPITWSFFSLSVPEWSLLAFVGLAVAVLIRLLPQRRLNLADSSGS
ncbi:disulfide bond formation protein B [Pseudomonas sp. GD04058]|uniref:disulfide bond formation protein B n=1 Tax=Pseudomonas sp. GD04058 TaxID=2975429 RepID=UPI00244683EA|nr:disulfide bond formation protein B [Pseudomonas sp. GD04058]MDG9883957.1 disulfide bond formation protein B [Pseudomonas sp. GD04058]